MRNHRCPIVRFGSPIGYAYSAKQIEVEHLEIMGCRNVRNLNSTLADSA
jgi:hypothetical protein